MAGRAGAADVDFDLTVTSGDEEGQTFTLAPGERSIIGRTQECNFRLPDPGISRRHCRVAHAHDHVEVVDLDSSNGTFVNGEQVERAPLHDGDELAVGPVVLRCVGRGELGDLADGETHPGQTRVQFSEGGSNTVVRRKVDTEDPWRVAEEVPAEEELESLRQAQKNLATAYRISRLLAKRRDMEGLFDGVIDSIFDSIDADRAGILLSQSRGDGGSDSSEDGAKARPAADELEVVAARTRGEEEKTPPERLRVSRTVVSDVLENGVSTLSRDATSDARFQGAQSVIAQDIHAVVCSPVATDDKILGVLYADSSSAVSAFSDTDVDLLALIGNQAGLAIHRAELMAELEEFFFDTIRAIVATIDAKDGYTHRHSERVAAFATAIAREWGVSDDEEMESVRLSGLLHDIGKIGVPDAILNKEGKLTDQEFAEVKKHPAHGESILEHIQNPRFEAVLPGVRHHHEKWDGSGYPDGLSGDGIPFLGRVLAVADVLDALTSDRSYRDAFTLEKTVGIIQEDAGSHFDPELAEAAAAVHDRGELEEAARRVDNRRGGVLDPVGSAVLA